MNAKEELKLEEANNLLEESAKFAFFVLNKIDEYAESSNARWGVIFTGLAMSLVQATARSYGKNCSAEKIFKDIDEILLLLKQGINLQPCEHERQ